MKRILCFCCGGLLTLAGLFADEPRPLGLEEARRLALARHPRISAAEFRSMAARQSAVEARAAYFPSITANATAVGTAEDNTRIAAGSLSNPGIFDRNAEGITVTQLITDFGRTANLSSSAKLHTSAELAGVDTVKSQVLLLTDTAYFEALRASSVVEVARETMRVRQTLLDQVGALATNKLKSELDLNFARVSFDEARLLALQAEGELSAANARLAMLIGFNEGSAFGLQDIPAETVPLPDASELVREALGRRPELRQLELEVQASRQFSKAERAASYPTISAIAAAGVIPFHDSHFDDEYAVAGVNLSVPVFAGGLYSARAKEARFKAEAAQQLLKARQEEVIRDVRIAALVASAAAERIGVAQRFVEHASQAFSLAETKYTLGAASIVELSQAQLSKTIASIEAASSRYNYQIQLANLRFQTGLPELAAGSARK